MRAEGLELDSEDPGWKMPATGQEFDKGQSIEETKVWPRIKRTEPAENQNLTPEIVDPEDLIMSTSLARAYSADNFVDRSRPQEARRPE